MPKRRTVILALLILTTAGCFAATPFQPVKIEGTAMEPALKDGDRVFINKNIEKLERGDIVIFLYPDDPEKSYVKRIVGLPKETVEISEGTILINGNTLEEPYVDPRNNQSHRSLAAITLAEDSYFVVGDNRDNSSDSRIWGPLERKFIYGKYMSTYSKAK